MRALGADYLSSLNDGRRVFIDGEVVRDVTAHPAFRAAVRSIASLTTSPPIPPTARS